MQFNSFLKDKQNIVIENPRFGITLADYCKFDPVLYKSLSVYRYRILKYPPKLKGHIIKDNSFRDTLYVICLYIILPLNHVDIPT